VISRFPAKGGGAGYVYVSVNLYFYLYICFFLFLLGWHILIQINSIYSHDFFLLAAFKVQNRTAALITAVIYVHGHLYLTHSRPHLGQGYWKNRM
jgi:amino acid transporter